MIYVASDGHTSMYSFNYDLKSLTFENQWKFEKNVSNQILCDRIRHRFPTNLMYWTRSFDGCRSFEVSDL